MGQTWYVKLLGYTSFNRKQIAATIKLEIARFTVTLFIRSPHNHQFLENWSHNSIHNAFNIFCESFHVLLAYK